jgi:hypothetical protein
VDLGFKMKSASCARVPAYDMLVSRAARRVLIRDMDRGSVPHSPCPRSPRARARHRDGGRANFRNPRPLAVRSTRPSLPWGVSAGAHQRERQTRRRKQRRRSRKSPGRRALCPTGVRCHCLKGDGWGQILRAEIEGNGINERRRAWPGTQAGGGRAGGGGWRQGGPGDVLGPAVTGTHLGSGTASSGVGVTAGKNDSIIRDVKLGGGGWASMCVCSREAAEG